MHCPAWAICHEFGDDFQGRTTPPTSPSALRAREAAPQVAAERGHQLPERVVSRADAGRAQSANIRGGLGRRLEKMFCRKEETWRELGARWEKGNEVSGTNLQAHFPAHGWAGTEGRGRVTRRETRAGEQQPCQGWQGAQRPLPPGWVRDEEGRLRRETIHRMTRRCLNWDYCGRGTYLITMVLNDRSRPVFGRVVGNPPMDGRALEWEA